MIVIAKPRRRVYLHELEDQLDWLENQRPKPRTGWLRWLLWVLLGLSGVSYGAAWYCLPNSTATLFLIFGAWTLFMAGDTSGRLLAAREVQEWG
jgi:hypothetical protein